MNKEWGLRERKKRETRHAIYRAAMRLFLERGFDDVSVAEVAAVANVSKMTVFNYFRTKEDLVLHPLEERVGEASRIVRERAPGESAVAALRRTFLDELARREPHTGLNDAVAGFVRLILGSQALLSRYKELESRSEDTLTATFAEETDAGPYDVTPRIAASQVIGVRRALIAENYRRLAAGQSADEIYPDAVAAAKRAFDLLESGLGDYCTRRG